MAGTLGIEPRLRGSESLVLPLYDIPINLADAAGLEPAYDLINSQVPYQLGYASIQLGADDRSRTRNRHFTKVLLYH